MRYVPVPDEINGIASSYGLGTIIGEPEELGGNSQNVNIAFKTDRGHYACKIRDTQDDVARVNFIHRAILYLHKKELPVPRLLTTPQGATFINLREHIVELHEYMYGNDMDTGNLKQLGAMAQVLAKIHDYLDGLESGLPADTSAKRPSVNYPCYSRLSRNFRRLAQAIHSFDGAVEDKERIRKEVRQVQESAWRIYGQRELLWPELREVFIHGDFHPGNVRFSGDEVAFVHDFDFVMLAERVYDIATLLVWIILPNWADDSTNTSLRDSDLKIFQHFVREYNAASSKPLTLKETEYLPEEMQFILLLYASKAGFGWGTLEKIQESVSYNLGLALWLESNKTTLINSMI